MKHWIPTSQTKVILIHEHFIWREKGENSQMLLTCLHSPLVMIHQTCAFNRHYCQSSSRTILCTLMSKDCVCWSIWFAFCYSWKCYRSALGLSCFNQLSWRKLASHWNRRVFWFFIWFVDYDDVGGRVYKNHELNAIFIKWRYGQPNDANAPWLVDQSCMSKMTFVAQKPNLILLLKDLPYG